MKVIQIIAALLAAIISVRGKTWDSKAHGFKKVTSAGWLSIFMYLMLALATGSIEYKEYQHEQEVNLKAEHRRFDALSLLAMHAYRIELMVGELEQSSPSEETLTRLDVYIELLSDALVNYRSSLKRKERIKAEELLSFAKVEASELKHGSRIINDLSSDELSRAARELRMAFCVPIMAGSPLCQRAFGNLTADEFKREYDEKRRRAILAAQKSLPELIDDIPMLEQLDIELQIKAAVPVGEIYEHIWLTDAQYVGGEFTGQIGNKPVRAVFLELGQPYTVSLSDVSDWRVVYKNVLYGAYMLRVSKDRMGREELQRFHKTRGYEIPPEPLLLPW